MPVTLYPADHPAAPWKRGGGETSSDQLLRRACSDEYKKSQRIIQSSFDEIQGNGIYSAKNGLVNAAWWAYSDHHHLQIRPEDVWFSILTQLNFYINKNAEELRSHFVAHEGKKEVVVYVEGTLDCGELALLMTKQMEEHIVDPKLREWIMPDFTTTEATDKVTAAILMMGSMQKYFSFTGYLCCGLPSVTLTGTKEDWGKIRARIEKIPQFGEEAETFAKLLRPVLDHLVRSFDHPQDPDILDFWGRIVHHEKGGSGPSYLSGWITAFCFWTPKGTCLYRQGLVERIEDPETGDRRAGCNIDGVQFHHVETGEVPVGYISVPVKLIKNEVETMTRMVAGSVGVKVCTRQDLIAAALPRPKKVTTAPKPETPQTEEKVMTTSRTETPEIEKKKVMTTSRAEPPEETEKKKTTTTPRTATSETEKKVTTTSRAETPEVKKKATTTPRVETPETEKKKANKIARLGTRLREFVLRLICLPGRDAGVSTSKESPDEVTVANEPQATAVNEPKATIVDEPQATTVNEPQKTTIDGPQKTTIDGPQTTTVDEPQAVIVDEPKVTTVDEPKAITVDKPPQAPDTVSMPKVHQADLKAQLDSVQPVSGWWMYELKAGKE